MYDPNIYNDFTLNQLRLLNGNGSALFDGVPTTVTGVVHGVNFQPTGYSFYLIDENNVGINVFSSDPGSYIVAEGDRLKVSGTIDQFNGLLEIRPDTIELVSSGNPINTPRQVTALTEMDESSYLFINELSVDSVSNISDAGFTVYTTQQGGSKILIRIDADALPDLEPGNFAGDPWVTVWGIGSQFDNSSPFTSGYQILALEVETFIDGIETIQRSAISMNPNPARDRVLFRSDLDINTIEIYSLDGKLLLSENVRHPMAEIQVNNMPVGLHLVKARTDQGIWTSLLSVVR